MGRVSQRRENSTIRGKYYCPVCGEPVNVNGTDWNQDVHNTMHRVCANQPDKDPKNIWGDNTSRKKTNPVLLSRAINGKWIPEENIGKYLVLLQDELDKTHNSFIKHKIISTLLKYDRECDKQKLSNRAVDIQREQFEFNKKRLEEGLPTQVMGVATDFNSQADDLLREIESITVEPGQIEDLSGQEAQGDNQDDGDGLE